MSELRRLHVAARYSEAAVFNGVVYLAGMVPECDATDIAAQTADVLAQVDRRLAECGSDRSRSSAPNCEYSRATSYSSL